MKRFAVLLKEFQRQLVVAVCVMIVLAVLLFAHLGSQPNALSASEVAAHAASHSLRAIWQYPINAPFLIPQHFVIQLAPHSVAASRVVSALYGALALLLLFIILRFWHGNFAAAIGAALCATSSWFLGVARLGTPNTLWLGVLALIAGGLWLKHTLRRNFVLLVGAIIVGAMFYVPGLVWFIIAALVWQRRTIAHELRHIKRFTKIVAALLLIIIMAPLIWAAIHQPSILRVVFGLPSHTPSPSELWRNLYHIPLTLFVWAPANPVHWLGHLPLLDIFEDAMFALGLYSFWRSRKLGRSKYLLGAAIVSIILLTVGGPVSIAVLIPVVYIVVAVGVLYLWDLWLQVFPHNPVARSAGMAILIIAVILSCNYQLRRYFIAWPHAAATKNVFTHESTTFDTITTSLRKEYRL